MKNWIFCLAVVLPVPSKLIPSEPIIASRDCILTIMAQRMNIEMKPEIAKPRIRPETTTSLTEFQDAIEKFWHFRPEVFSNVYNQLQNEIFIFTDREYYDSKNRSVFDSLAHELVHYLQKEYRFADFTQGGDDFAYEADAIDQQTWFRETYRAQFQGDEFICPLPESVEKQ